MKVAQNSALVGFASALAISFFAGTRSFSSTTPFSHADVVNAASECGENEYIGGCATCSDCSAYEYAAGGCSYFKDTFCTLCEPIRNCPQKNIECDTKDNERCVMCDPGYYDDDCKPCTVCDPGYYESQRCTQTSDTVCEICSVCPEHQRTTVACTYYTDTECEECSDCKVPDYIMDDFGNIVQGDNFFQAVSCETVANMQYMFPRSVYTVGADTVCQECAEPVPGEEYVTEICTMFTDTKIENCNFCECQDLEAYRNGGMAFYGASFADSDEPTIEEVWRARLKHERDTVEAAQVNVEAARLAMGEAAREQQRLYARARLNPTDQIANANWRQSQAAYTSRKEEFEAAEEALVRAQDLPEARTSTCERRTQDCQPGNYNEKGVPTQCARCTPPRKRGKKGQLYEWEVFACFGESDALYQPCAECMPGEYIGEECTLIGDASCPDCRTDLPLTYLDACEDGALRCDDDEATACVDCKEGFFGDACCYHRYHGACGSITTRERAANRGGFRGDTSEQFILFCMELCDEFPDCLAFELKDDGEDLDTPGPTAAFTGMRTSTCYFKGAFSQEDCLRSDQECDYETRTKFRSTDPSFDCYSNICRQNSAMKEPALCTSSMIKAGACTCPGNQKDCPIRDENGKPTYKNIQVYYPEAYPVDGKPEEEAEEA